VVAAQGVLLLVLILVYRSCDISLAHGAHISDYWGDASLLHLDLLFVTDQTKIMESWSPAPSSGLSTPDLVPHPA